MSRDYTSEPTRKHLPSQHIQCSKCGLIGGTLVKDGKDGYSHPDNDSRCKLLQGRRKV